MWWMLLAIIGCYAFAALLVRMAARVSAKWRAGMHVVLFAGNQGERLEWYLRRLRWWSLRTGRDVCVTLVDCGSTDDTARIAERFGRGAGAVNVVRSDEIADASGDLASDPAALKASWPRQWSNGEGHEEGRFGDGYFGGSARDARGAGGTLLINLSDPADVAMLP